LIGSRHTLPMPGRSAGGAWRHCVDHPQGSEAVGSPPPPAGQPDGRRSRGWRRDRPGRVGAAPFRS